MVSICGDLRRNCASLSPCQISWPFDDPSVAETSWLTAMPIGIFFFFSKTFPFLHLHLGKKWTMTGLDINVTTSQAISVKNSIQIDYKWKTNATRKIAGHKCVRVRVINSKLASYQINSRVQKWNCIARTNIKAPSSQITEWKKEIIRRLS